mmetsp:Transcript_1917/g.2717  ORF Transcript_1917/g.2717 Transcript_1917/m.2717 type:complete len:383 (-) Transcript_1917:333-1481(-)|eukprot:CAMPEP_0113938076 /NCGR_PEP_ID=MMETSP1339-20121228/4489_1 /TAXON_ID=94617 /ORGANISM="Fibrocapsa japonica" /LENGTH=382 /DNA_ID=CAMNT_0000941013 /DNA_START=43 /DNA_END=1191 /DNA_ORIENTATION=- /assembly_acc=CAM_ASM_000762
MASELIPSQPVVIDNGTGVLKAGFAGGDRPKVVFQSHVGRPKHRRMMPGGALDGQEVFVGSKVAQHRGALSLSYPMEHGVVTNWRDMERIWDHVYSREHLNVSAEDHPVLLTEAPLNPDRHREEAAQVFFEAFNAPALFCAPQAILSLYASGRTTGVVLDSGDGVTHCVPVYEGFAIPHAINRLDLAGRDVTYYLQGLLRRAGYNFTTSAELEIVQQIKEDQCYVAFKPQEEERKEQSKQQDYALPDGQIIQLGSERYRAPELLFHPELMGHEAVGGNGGVQGCLVRSVLQSDMELRRALFSQIVLAGGTTTFRGFGDRLLNEVRLAAPPRTKIRISAPPERRLSTWIGGSILASLASFKTMCVTQDEWRENGPRIMHAKTL